MISDVELARMIVRAIKEDPEGWRAARAGCGLRLYGRMSRMYAVVQDEQYKVGRRHSARR
jgi:2-keto-3-deoxy-L-rhamnonate aldolase RhmA